MTRLANRVQWWPLPLVILVAVCSAWAINRTVIHPDEVGFILNARRIAGVGGPSLLPYYPGYSALLVPAVSVSDDIGVVFRLVQGTNVLLAACTVVLSGRLLRRFDGGLGAPALAAAVGVALLYPPFRLYGALALSENLLVLLSVASPLALQRWLGTRSSPPSAPTVISSGLMTGLVFVVHPRAISLVLAGLLAAASLHELLGWRRVGVFAFSAGVGLVAARFGVDLVLDADTEMFAVGQSAKTSFGGLLRSALQPRALVVLPFTALGQIFYASVASFGLVPIGIAALWSLRRCHELRAAVVAVGANFVISLAVGAMFMNQGIGDKAIYGRYLDAALLPLLLLGATWVIKGPTPLMGRLAILAAPVSASILLAVRGADAFDGRLQLLNISGLSLVVRYTEGIDIRAIAVFGALTGLVLVALAAYRWSLALLVVVLLELATIAATMDRFHEVATTFEDQAQLPAFVREELLPALDGEPVCFATEEVLVGDASWYQQNLRLEMLDVDFVPWSVGESTTCDLALSGDSQVPGASAIAAEGSANVFLWVFDGPRVDQLERQGIVGNVAPGAPLPFRVPLEIQLVSATYSEESNRLLVTVEVMSEWDRPVFSSLSFPGGVGGVSVGVEFRDVELQERRGEPFRLHLEGVLQPGVPQVLTAEVPLSVSVEGGVLPLEPGTHAVHVELVQEGERWLGERYGSDAVVDLSGIAAPDGGEGG